MPLPAVIAALLIAVSSPADSARCAEADRFLREDRRMATVVEDDTIDDWRSGRKLAGCRVTAAGATAIGVAKEAVRFYERVRAAGWVRTPDPRDAPNEASLRFRRGATDCLFNVYAGGLLNTEAEGRVMESVTPRPGEVMYQVLVQCATAVAARAR